MSDWRSVACVFMVGMSLAAVHTLRAASEQAPSGSGTGTSSAAPGTLPKDVDPVSLYRLPSVNREGLDERPAVLSAW